ncbi:MAG: putative Zn-dependent protease [Halioglobus sp.]|jgi:predicted Zn-dependent protease
MTLFKSQTWIRASLLAVPVVAVQLAVSQVQSDFDMNPFSSAFGQEEKAKKQQETRRTPALRNKVYEKLAEAQVAAEAKDWKTARGVLDNMIEAGGKKALNSYELANVYNLYAFIYYSAEDYPNALKSYEEVVSQPDIPLAMEINTKYTIAQLYFVLEDWNKGIAALKVWFDVTENPPASAYVMLAQGYYQVKDYKQALVNVQTAINMYKEKDKVPKEQWFNLARFLYFESNDVNSAVGVLEELLKYYPKKQYWVQLSHMYGEQKKESRQLATMDTAYVQGMLDKGTEQINMAYLYLNGEVPYRAAVVMDRGIKDESIEPKSKNYELLGNAWRQAQEIGKAIPAMELAAAKSDSGELYARLGNVYLDGDQFKKAITAINKGLSRGGVKRPDTARLVLGMAYFNDNQFNNARKAFGAAKKDERSEKYATQWLKYLNAELERQEKLKIDI